jgi:hypothetical protein
MRDRVDERQLLSGFGERSLGSRMQRARARQNASQLVHNLAQDMLTHIREAEWRT